MGHCLSISGLLLGMFAVTELCFVSTDRVFRLRNKDHCVYRLQDTQSQQHCERQECYLVLELILGAWRHPFLLEAMREFADDGCHASCCVQVSEPRKEAL